MLRRYHRFAVVLVMMMLATPMVVSILSADPDSMSFKGEEPARPPPFPTRIRDWLNLSGRIDAYLRDHFGLRREMIRAWSAVAHLWLRSGNAFVYVGLDGSLFYRGEDTVRQSAGLLVRKSSVIETADTINRVRANLDAIGVKFIFAPPPNAATIYPDRLPVWARNRDDRPTEYDLLLEALAARGVHAVDLRPPLRAARTQGKVFLEHDSHWSTRGAIAGFNAVAAAAAHAAWQFDPAAVLSPPTRMNGGDLARMLGIADDVVEQTQMLMLTLAPAETERFDAKTFVITPKLPNGPTIMVLGDSFTAQFPSMMIANARPVAWTHHERCSFDWKWIEQFHPDEVWWIPTERYMTCTPGGRPKGMPATSGSGE